MPSYRLDIIVNGQDNASSVLNGIGGAMRGLGDVAFKALAAGGVAVGAGLAVAVKSAMDFDKTMSGVAAVGGKEAVSRMDELSAAALQIGKDTSFGASEAASAMEMLVANGLSVTDVLDGAARATVDLAAATGADLTTAATVGSDAMNIFGISAKDMGKAINGISGVTVASKFDINDYALALAQGGGVAKASGVSFDDFNTTITAISPLFASGSDAGTSFKTMLTTLIPKSDAAYQAMQSLGLITAEGANQFFNADGSMRDMAGVAGLLQGALGGLSDEQRNTALSTIFGADASRAAAALAETGADKFRLLAGSIAEVDAAAQAATRLDNLAGDVEALKGSLETAGIQLGQAFTPLLRDAAQAAGEFVNTQLIDRDWSPLVNGISATIGAARSLIGTLNEQGLGGVLGIVGQQLRTWITDAIPVAGTGLQSYGTQLLGWAQGQLPIWQGALAGWAGAAGQWVIDALPGLLTNLQGLATQAIGWAQSAAIEWGAALLPWAQKAGAWAIEALPQLLLNLGKLRNDAIGWALDSLPLWIDALAGWAGAAGQWIVNALPGLLRNFAKLQADLLDRVGTALPGIVESLAKWGAAFVDWAIVAGPKLLAELTPMAGRLVGWIAERVPIIAEQLGKWATAFVGWLGPKIPSILIAMGTAFGDMLTYIAQQAPAIIQTLGQWGNAFWNWATTDGKTALGDAMLAMASNLWNNIGDNFINILNPGSIGFRIVRGIADGIYQAWGGLTNWFSNLFSSLQPGQTGGSIPYPSFAGGVRNFAGGLAIVGERGPELVSLPGGSSVFTNGESSAMLSGIGSSAPRLGAGIGSAGPGASAPTGGGVTINVTVQGSVLKERDLALAIREQFLDYQRNNISLGFS